ncbi:MAG TPA: rhomboid family intramembrane serine protease [Geobacterales bacterium]|nr:rhomboid family intramembrane serine protease [Geobacterales bacterium]
MGLSDYLEQHEEQAFLLKAFATIIAIILLKSFLEPILGFIFFIFPIFFFLYIRLAAAVEGRRTMDVLRENITFTPVMYSEEERHKELIPWVTYVLIAINAAVFYMVEANPAIDAERLLNSLMFVPQDPTFANIPLSAITSLFLHAGPGHLWGNMMFLWVLGSVIERRIGAGNYFVAYITCGLIANLVALAMELIFNNDLAHGIGASGAIAGIMGIFAVRCYFKSMVFPLPILGIFSLIIPISLKIRLNSLVIVGLFFLMDLSGGIGQLAGTDQSNIGHWAHVGGMLGGILAASLLKVGSSAIEERHLDIGKKAATAAVGFEDGERSLRIALEQNPHNPEGWLHLARLKSKFNKNDEGRDAYQRAITLLARSKPEQAADVFDEFYRIYMAPVAAPILYQLATLFFQRRDLEMASRCLEMAAKSPDATPDLKERALYQCAFVLEQMGLTEAARNHYDSFLATFPHSALAPKVRLKLGIG